MYKIKMAIKLIVNKCSFKSLYRQNFHRNLTIFRLNKELLNYRKYLVFWKFKCNTILYLYYENLKI